MRTQALWLAALLALAAPWPARAGGEPMVVIYAAYGLPDAVWIRGRVLEDDGSGTVDTLSGGAHAVASLEQLESDELPDVDVELALDRGVLATARSDDEGMFEVALRPRSPLPVGAHRLRATTPKLAGRGGEGTLYVLSPAREALVVSDVDDTIVQTGVTHKLRMAIDILLLGGKDIAPVPGAPKAYQAAARSLAPFFYLSGSPVNLQGRVRTFIQTRGFPDGPLFLKNFGQDALTAQLGYKLSRLQLLLQQLPERCLVLIGDSGERDPEVYAALRAEQPQRVLEVIIRKVPDTDVSSTRLRGMTAVDHFLDEELIARAVRRPCPAR